MWFRGPKHLRMRCNRTNPIVLAATRRFTSSHLATRAAQPPTPRTGLLATRSLRSPQALSRRQLSTEATNSQTAKTDNLDVRRYFGGIALGLSAAAAVGALFLVEEDPNIIKYENFPDTSQITPRHSSSGSTGKVMQVGAISVGEQISFEELLERYEFDTITRGERTKRKKQIQVIGKGAYGRVVRATQKSTGRKVAMKIVPRTAMSAEALLREVEVLRRVRGHDHIIHLQDTFGCGGEWYVVTELCEGGELLDKLISNGPYKEQYAAELIENCVSAIHHIHRSGFVHLDIKPENLVFSNSESAHEKYCTDCRIIDFGMAKEISEISGRLSMIAQGTDKAHRLGTMAYWSPEQIQSVMGKDGRGLMPDDLEVVDTDPRACDMWALGLILYITLLGCHPFDPTGNGNEYDIAARMLKGRFRFDIHGDKLRLSAEACDLISHLLDPNPHTRYNAEQVLDHDWVKGRKHRPEVQKLPYSWSQDGYDTKGPSDYLLDSPPDTKQGKRLQPYLGKDVVEAFVEAVVLAAAGSASKSLKRSFSLMDVDDNSNASTHRSHPIPAQYHHRRLLKEAFSIIDTDNKGKILLSDIASLYKLTGDVSHTRIPTVPAEEDGGITIDEFVAILRRNNIVARRFAAGETVFKQGAEPQGFFVLLSGKARVEFTARTAGDKEQVYDYAALEAGNVFGGTALVQGKKARAGTIRCVTPAQVLFVPKEEYLNALASSPALNSALFHVVREQQAKRISALVEYLKPPSLRKCIFPRGHVIFHQNESANEMYLISKGVVSVNVMAPTSAAKGASVMGVTVAERGPGDITGMSALLKGQHRTTNVQCLTDVEALAINAEDLQNLMQEPIFRFYVDSQLQWRKEAWQETIADVERGVSEPQLLAMLKDGDEESFEEMRAILTNMSKEEYNAGDAIIQKGTTPKNFFVIESGVVVVEYTCPTGEVLHVAQLGPGDHFGEQAILENRKEYISNMRCVTPVTVRKMNRRQFLKSVGAGDTVFAKAVTNAMRQRQHRWVRNILSLAKASQLDEDDDGDSPIVSRLLVRRGDVLFQTGDPASALYYVHRGTVQLLDPEDERDPIKGSLGPGDTIGLECFSDGVEQKYTAVCSSPRAVLSKIPRHSLDVLIRDNTYVSSQLERHLKKMEPQTQMEIRSNEVQASE